MLVFLHSCAMYFEEPFNTSTRILGIIRRNRRETSHCSSFTQEVSFLFQDRRSSGAYLGFLAQGTPDGFFFHIHENIQNLKLVRDMQYHAVNNVVVGRGGAVLTPRFPNPVYTPARGAYMVGGGGAGQSLNETPLLPA